MSLSFLSNITLASNEEVRPSFSTAKAARPAVDRLPEGNRIRLFKNGAIYPSAALVALFLLEYLPKDSEDPSFGLDILSSKVFPNTAHLEQSFLIVGIVPKSAPKVDVFGSTKYYSKEEAEGAEGEVKFAEGDAKSSVLDQGTTTFGKESLIPMLEEVYGIKFGEDQKFIDLEVVDSQQLTTNDGHYFIPKPISRGEKKGQMEAVVRKDIKMFPLVPVSLLEGESDTVEDKGADLEIDSPEEANVPEIDMTKSASVEPSIEEIIDDEPETTTGVEIDGSEVTTEIDIDEAAQNVEAEAEETASEDDEFDGIVI